MLAILGVLGYYLFRQFKYWTFARGYDDSVARAKSAGLPLTAAEVDPRSTPPDDQNAALLIAQVDPSLPYGKGHEDDNYTPWNSADDLALSRATLKRYSWVVDLARKVADRPTYYLARNWNEGSRLVFPEFGKLKQLAQTCTAQTYVEALDGRWEKAIRDLSVVPRIAHLVAQEPTLIAALVSNSIDTLFYKVAARIMHLGASKPLVLAEIQRQLSANPPQATLRYGINCEFFSAVVLARNASSLGLFELLEGEFIDSENSPEIESKYEHMPLRIEEPTALRPRAYYSFTLRYWADFAELAAKKDIYFPEFHRLATQIDDRYERDSDKLPLGYYLAPPYPGTDAFFSDQARWLAAEGLASCLVFRANHHRLPSSLDEAGFQANDPFDGLPLRYISKGNSCVVYSIGSNAKDDLGANHSDWPQVDKESDDIAAHFPPLAGRPTTHRLPAPGE